MKGCFTTLLFAFIFALIFSFFGRSCHKEKLETVLDDRVVGEIEKTYPGIRVKYDHLTAMVTGEATPAQVEEIRAKIRQLSLGNGRIYFDVTNPGTPPVPPPAPVDLRPSHFSVTRSGDRVLLVGEVDSKQSVDLIGAEAARLEGVSVENQLKVGANTAAFPAMGALSSISALLKAAKEAKLEASPEQVVVSGIVETDRDKRELMVLFTEDQWEGAKIVDQIRVARNTPANFTAAKQGPTVILRGAVDADATREALGNAAAAAATGITVDNQLEISDKVMAFPALERARLAIPALLGATKDGAIEVDGKSVVLKAMVKDQGVKDNLLGLFTPGEWNNLEIFDQIQITPKNPATFSLVRAGKSLSLIGKVDSEATKKALAAAAAIEGYQLNDQLEVHDDIQPFPAIPAALAAIPTVAKEAERGKIEIAADRVIISGEVPNQESKDRILALFGADKWNGLAIVDQIKIAPPKPAQFTLRWTNGKWTLLGQVDSPETKDAIGKSFADAGIEADNQIATGEGIAPVGPIMGAFAKLPAAVGSLDFGEFVWGPGQLVIEGIAPDQSTKDQVTGFFQTDPWNGLKLVDRIQLVKPYGFSLTRAPGKAVLEGNVGNEEAKQLLGSASILEGLALENQIKVDRQFKPFESGAAAREGIPAWMAAVNEGKLTITPEQIEVTGEVKDQKAKDLILGNFGPDRWPGKKLVDGLKIAVPMMSPSLSWKQDNPHRVTLNGRVSSEAVKQALVALAKERLGEGGEVVDKLTAAENIKPASWLEGFSNFAKESLPKVHSTVIEINDQTSSLTGAVPNQETLKEVSLAFSAIDAPGKVDIHLNVRKMESVKRTASPVVEITGKGSRLTVAGKVPSKTFHDSLVNTIVNIKDAGIDTLDERALQVGDEVKEESYLKPLPVFVGKFLSGTVKEREMTLKNKKLTLQGVVASEQEKREILAAAAPLRKEGVAVVDKIRIEAPKVTMVPPAPAPGEPKKTEKSAPGQINQAAGGKLFSVYFGTGEFHLRDSEKSRVQNLVDQAKKTEGRIVIEGYADERGTDDLNAFLSNERATRLREVLVNNGIEDRRIISVIGKGSLPGGIYRQHRRTDVRFIEENEK